jgi:hypothetical protein
MGAPIDLRLARHGAILLLLGMLTGFVIVDFHNRGAGNAAHLTGLIGGYGLIALGLLWPKLNLGRWSGAGAWITAASLYLNWLGLVLQGRLWERSQGSEFTAPGPDRAVGPRRRNHSYHGCNSVAIVGAHCPDRTT